MFPLPGCIRFADCVVFDMTMSLAGSDGNVGGLGQKFSEPLDRLSRQCAQVFKIAINCPSATTSSILTSSDLSFPAAGEATGISIFIASTNAMSSPSPTLLPASTASAQTRPATSVTILISGIPFSEGTVWRIIALANGLLLSRQIA